MKTNQFIEEIFELKERINSKKYQIYSIYTSWVTLIQRRKLNCQR